MTKPTTARLSAENYNEILRLVQTDESSLAQIASAFGVSVSFLESIRKVLELTREGTGAGKVDYETFQRAIEREKEYVESLFSAGATLAQVQKDVPLSRTMLKHYSVKFRSDVPGFTREEKASPYYRIYVSNYIFNMMALMPTLDIRFAVSMIALEKTREQMAKLKWLDPGCHLTLGDAVQITDVYLRTAKAKTLSRAELEKLPGKSCLIQIDSCGKCGATYASASPAHQICPYCELRNLAARHLLKGMPPDEN